MSKHSSPIETFFEMQRETIKGTEAVFATTLSAPKQFGEAMSLTGEPGREMRDQALEASRESFHSTLDAVESVSGETTAVTDLRESVDETVDSLKESNADACNSVTEEYDRVEEELLESYSDRLELLLGFNEEIETQLVETYDAVSEELEEVAEETVDAVEETAESATEATPVDIEVSEPDAADEATAAAADAGDDSTGEDVPADKVECLVCGENFRAITHPHLQTHDMTIDEYREEFGDDARLLPDDG